MGGGGFKSEKEGFFLRFFEVFEAFLAEMLT